MIKEYRKYVAENRNLIYISTFLVILLRGGFLFMTDAEPQSHEGFFWNIIAPYLNEKHISFVCSFLFTVMIGLSLSHLSEKYVLIRNKTSLPYVFTIFLLSSSPQLIYMQPAYVGVVALLLSTDILFSSYQQQKSPGQAFSIGFILASGSLIIPSLLAYLIIFWIGFYLMRSLNFKVLLSSLLGVAMICWLAFIGLLYYRKIDEVLYSLVDEWHNLSKFAVLQMDVRGAITLIVFFVFLIVVLADGYVNIYKDKIQVRTSFSFLRLLLLVSSLIYFFLSLHSQSNLLLIFTISGFIFAHFFALADKKWKIYFFVSIVVFYCVNYVGFLLE